MRQRDLQILVQNQVQKTCKRRNRRMIMLFQDLQQDVCKQLWILERLQLVFHKIVHNVGIKFVVFLKMVRWNEWMCVDRNVLEFKKFW